MRVFPPLLALFGFLSQSSSTRSERAREASPVVASMSARVMRAFEAQDDTPPPERQQAVWTSALQPIRFVNTNGLSEATVSLYATDGSIDPEAVAKIGDVLDDGERPRLPPAPRLLQLIVKAAYHFKSRDVFVVSSFRPSTRGGSRHASGEAIDFILPTVASNTLAAWLRKLPRVGVGIYTHPRTRFVHLDVRDESFHWLDASPPGRTWRERGMTDHAAVLRDRTYSPQDDLPEAALL